MLRLSRMRQPGAHRSSRARKGRGVDGIEAADDCERIHHPYVTACRGMAKAPTVCLYDRAVSTE